jgi:putative membrane protein
MRKLFAVLATLTLAFAPPAFAQKSGKLDDKDARFMRQMAEANLAEVHAGRMALNQASSGEVKRFAEHMVEEHGGKLSDARTLAKEKDVRLPEEPSKKHQEAMKKLQQADGKAFDKAYMQQMVRDHQEALKLHQDAAKNAKDKELKAAAEKSVPAIRKHLDEAKRITASLK